MQARVRRRILLILPGLLVLEVVRSQKIIFRSRTHDGRKILVAVHKEFNFTFSPPAVIVYANSHKSSYIVAFALNSVNNNMIGICVLIRASILRMKISFILPY